MTQHYEILLIFPIKLEEKEREAALSKIFGFITSEEGKVSEPEHWGNKQFAYEIKHQTNGYYVLAEFDLAKDKLKKFDADLRLMPEVLRYLITIKYQKTEADIAKEKMIQEKIAEKKVVAAKEEIIAIKEKEKPAPVAKVVESKPKESTEAGKIKLDDLDEKLDEILKEKI
ncbi:MAG: 30S ribosomal protein S6 [Candidatus Kerfeldbacteria bacterium]